jgi:hypothetical protein
MTKIEVNSDIEDALNRAFNMSSIVVTLAEKALNRLRALRRCGVS